MIAFDIDGCINGIKEDLIRIGKGFFSIYPVTLKKGGYYLKEIFEGAPDEAYEEFWEKYGYEIYTNPPLPYVWETMNYIKNNNIDACYITTRDIQKTFHGISFDVITSEWLKNYDIEFPVYYRKDKDIAAKSLGITLMVEDKPDHIMKLQKVTNVLIFKHPYNEHLNGEFVENWNEILEKIRTEY